MKTDRVLTMSECLANWYGGVSCVKPPADDARHVPITAEGDIDLESEAHPCKEPNARCVPRFFFSKQVRQNKMEYVIAFGVVAVMALYVLIIARCLREPEWQ